MILLPKYRTSQPNGPTEINWGNPITRGLATVFLPTQRYPSIDLVTKVFDTSTTRGSLLPGTNGVRYAVTGTNVAWTLNFAPVGILANYPAVSVFTLFEQYDTTTTGVIFGGGNNASQYARFEKNNNGSISFVPNTNSGGSAIAGPVLNTNQVYALAAINQGNERELFVDAVSQISSNTSITFINGAYGYAGSSFLVVNQYRRIGLYCGYVWTRRLTPFEIKSLTDNPWQIFRPQRLIFPFTGAAAQTLTPSLYTNTQTFYDPTVTPGTVTLQPGLYTNQQTFYDPTAVLGPAPQTLTPSLYTNTQTFYSPTVIPEQFIEPGLYTNQQVFYGPTVTQVSPQTIYPGLFVNQNQFFPFTVQGAGGGGPSVNGWAAERRRLELSLEQRQATQTLAKSKNKVAKRVAKRIEQYVAAEIDAQAEIEQIAQLQVEIAKLEALHDNRKQFNQEMREAAQILKDFVQDEQDAITLLMLVQEFDARCVIEATASPDVASLMGSA